MILRSQDTKQSSFLLDHPNQIHYRSKAQLRRQEFNFRRRKPPYKNPSLFMLFNLERNCDIFDKRSVKKLHHWNVVCCVTRQNSKYLANLNLS